jgi:hypothetical protein
MVTVYIAMKDNPALHVILQKRTELVQIFHFGSFEFTLLEVVPGMDVCRVSRQDWSIGI